jgi:hypothetical protein
MMRAIRRFLLSAAMALASAHAAADIFVIVNAASPVRSLTNKEAVDLFMRRTRVDANGEQFVVCDLARDNTVRADFYRVLTRMSQAQINSYWARLMFSGQVMPPQAFASEQEVLDMVRRHPGGIGYVSHDPQDSAVRVVLLLKDGL